MLRDSKELSIMFDSTAIFIFQTQAGESDARNVKSSRPVGRS